MDYRNPMVFGENWSPSRYDVLPYFAVEKRVFNQPGLQHILDLGCAAGWNMSRFVQYGHRAFGLDVVPERLKWARRHGPVMVASGLNLPLPDQSFDVIYIQHVLHHIGDVARALSEVRRCLRPGGALLLVETVEDHPVIRWGRTLHPSWLGDAVTARFRLAGLQSMLDIAGFEVCEVGQYSVCFWLWEILPDRWPILEKLTPAFVAIEQVAARVAPRYGAHCYLLARSAT